MSLEAVTVEERPQATGETTCRVCGRRLTDPESVRAGIGPVCAEKQKKQDLMERFIEESMCPECGKQSLYADSLYCPNCGAPMKARTVEVVPA